MTCKHEIAGLFLTPANLRERSHAGSHLQDISVRISPPPLPGNPLASHQQQLVSLRRSVAPPFDKLLLFPGIYRLHSAFGYSSSEYITRASTRLGPCHSRVKRRLCIRRAFFHSYLVTCPSVLVVSRVPPRVPARLHLHSVPPYFGHPWPRTPGPSFRDFSNSESGSYFVLLASISETKCPRPSGNSLLERKRSSASSAFAPSAPEHFLY